MICPPCGTVDVSLVFASLSEVVIGQTGHAALLDREGKILYANNPESRKTGILFYHVTVRKLTTFDRCYATC